MSTIAAKRSKVNGKFMTFDVFKSGVSGSELADGTAQFTTWAIPFSRIEAAQPHPFAPNATRLTLSNGTHQYVRGDFNTIVAQLNRELPLFKLEPWQTELVRMREAGYSLSQRATAFQTTPLQIARDEAAIDRKLEAAEYA